VDARRKAGRDEEGNLRMAEETDAKLIEAARKLFAGNWQFASASPTIETLPPIAGLEVAFAGRSNVGKSSLINALTGRNNLARTSRTPGRTQELIFFEGPSKAGLRLVDMPGYGYARAPKSKVAAWTALIYKFLQGRSSLARVYVLVDARHGLKDEDLDVLKTLDRAAVSYQVVLTKADQVKQAELSNHICKTQAVLAKHAAAFPEVLATSSRTGTGMPELRGAMVRLLEERG
jgi:GTP-binding protein